MAIIMMQARWSRVGIEQWYRLEQALSSAAHAAEGCYRYATQHQPVAQAVLLSSVWDGPASADAFSRAMRSSSAAVGLADPQVALFQVPDLFAAGYRRPFVAVPTPRSASEQPASTART